MKPGHVLQGLDPEQCAVVTAPRGPVCVLAGAGTGKTRAITRRIAALVRGGHVATGQVLAVTYTARAAGEMRSRLRVLGVSGVQARTFHAATMKQLRYFWPRAVGEPPRDLLENKIRLVARAAHRVGLGTEAEVLRDVAGEIEWAKSTLVAPDGYPAAAAHDGRDTPAPVEQIAEVYRGYERLKDQARLLDWDDYLLHTAAILEDNADVASEFRDRYRCFVVYEYQDITPLQQRVLDAWLGDRDDLTVVGDANQTIYSYNGASPRPLLDFTRRFPEAVVVRLVRNYRSTPEVVSLANRVIGAARNRPAGSRLRLTGQRESGPEPRFAEYDDEPAEAAAVVERIKELRAAGVPASEIAILYRVNAQSEVYEQALTEAGVPYLVRGGERFFARAEVRQAMLALRQAASRDGGRDAGGLAAAVRETLEPLGLTEQPPAGGAARQRWDSLHALVELAEELAGVIEGATLTHYTVELDARAQAQHPPTVEGITLASLHAAKGLEWDAVFLVGLVDGTLPIQHADQDQDAIEEERRLFYVGVTRARKHLSLSWALSRSAGGRRHRRRSRFLYGLIPENHPAARVPASRSGDGRDRRSAKAKAVCRVCGAPLIGTMAVKLGRCEDCPSNLDEELLGRLRTWRTDRAHQLKVPAYVVFTDATLMAIAEQQPTDAAGLVAISGIGATKLDRFGADVIALVQGAEPENVPAQGAEQG